MEQIEGKNYLTILEIMDIGLNPNKYFLNSSYVYSLFLILYL